MKILKNNNQSFDNDIDSISIKSITKLHDNKFKSIKLLTGTFIASIYAFGFGYSLSYCTGKVIYTGISFLILFALTYYIIMMLHEFIHSLILPNCLSESVIIRYNLKRLSIYAYSNIEISKGRMLLTLAMPLLLLTIIPTIISYILGFSIYLYVLASVNAIISAEDFMNFFLIVKNTPNNSKIYMKDEKLYYNEK
ncbi:metalloprotease family protein [Clostridium chauvoei]|uniref:Zincin peptidase n=2 Tax=Clostridium chauvoei TaxID=46867 RepID=S6ER93_9CLOT|nr:metalloprotease family protein [Clostridium chauvoei]ATD55078.1 hypothetical protein BTM20_07440 [Clostridium chauvoei]ATD57248.1 hypothetical protein BTM21_05615 [Clostridium chauvoei]MBX7279422.1 metalloprotease family protein [Clostridium chauvoei]MBX7282492.1 metalloprotease family protein [Clostridium chauvoei]MBX7285621.1 metalloprotease family protein [Clostridium chauvoei]